MWQVAFHKSLRRFLSSHKLKFCVGNTRSNRPADPPWIEKSSATGAAIAWHALVVVATCLPPRSRPDIFSGNSSVLLRVLPVGRHALRPSCDETNKTARRRAHLTRPPRPPGSVHDGLIRRGQSTTARKLQATGHLFGAPSKIPSCGGSNRKKFGEVASSNRTGA